MSRRCPFNTNSKLYEDYYGLQVGHGLPVFIGGRNYRGHGLGSILAGIGRAVVPLLKSGGKALLKEGARTGMRVAHDVLSGQSLGSSFKQRAGQAGKRLLNQVVDGVKRRAGGAGGGPPPKRRIKAPRTRKTKQKRKRNSRDIFG